jgi:hypothetical protein
VAWHDRDGSNYTQVFFRRVSAEGVEIGNESVVTSTGVPSRRPCLVWNGTGYAVAYTEGSGGGRHIVLSRFDAAGGPVGGPTTVTNLQTASTARPWIVWTGGEYAVTWSDQRVGNGEIYLARIDAAGNRIGDEVRWTDSPADSTTPRMVWTGTEYGLAWSETLAVRFARVGCNCYDDDGDGWTSCNDNCPDDVNPAQSDVDADHEGDVCDLDDGWIYLLPGPKTEVHWQAEAGFDGWNLYKGDLDVLRSTGVYTQLPGSNDLAWRWCGLATPAASDPEPPGANRTAFYLVSGTSGGVEGGLGADSSGTPRPNGNPCP